MLGDHQEREREREREREKKKKKKKERERAVTWTNGAGDQQQPRLWIGQGHDDIELWFFCRNTWGSALETRAWGATDRPAAIDDQEREKDPKNFFSISFRVRL